jgi:hypothetical protein
MVLDQWNERMIFFYHNIIYLIVSEMVSQHLTPPPFIFSVAFAFIYFPLELLGSSLLSHIRAEAGILDQIIHKPISWK